MTTTSLAREAADLLLQVERARRRAEAQRLEVLVDLANTYRVDHDDMVEVLADHYRRYGGIGTPTASEFLALEVAALLRVSTVRAAGMIADALDLYYRHPQLWTAVQDDELEASRAAHAARLCHDLTPTTAEQVGTRWLRKQRGLPWGRAFSLLEKLIIEADPEHAAEKERIARESRDVSIWGYAHGAMSVSARVDVLDARYLDAAVEQLAGLLAPQHPSLNSGQLRAKALGLLAHPAYALALQQAAAQQALPIETPIPDAHAELLHSLAEMPAHNEALRIRTQVPGDREPADLLLVPAWPASPPLGHAQGHRGCGALAAPDAQPSAVAPPKHRAAGCDMPPQGHLRHPTIDATERTGCDEIAEPQTPGQDSALIQNDTVGTYLNDGWADQAGGWQLSYQEAMTRRATPMAEEPHHVGGWQDPATRGDPHDLPGHVCGTITVPVSKLAPKATVVVHLSIDPDGELSPAARIEKAGYLTTTVLAELLADKHLTIRPVIDVNHIPAEDQYVPSVALRKAVEWTYPAELFPYSTRSSTGLDLDHISAYQSGAPGQTRFGNLVPISRRVHRAKTAGYWTSQPTTGAELTWTSPLGYRYHTTPEGTQPLNS